MRKQQNGKLFCTRALHWVAVEEFAVRPNGHRLSWCKECKRTYDKGMIKQKRKVEEEQMDTPTKIAEMRDILGRIAVWAQSSCPLRFDSAGCVVCGEESAFGCLAGQANFPRPLLKRIDAVLTRAD